MHLNEFLNIFLFNLPDGIDMSASGKKGEEKKKEKQ